MKKYIFLLSSTCLLSVQAIAQSTCTGSATFDNSTLADYPSSTIFGNGIPGYVTVCIDSGSVIGSDTCSGNDEGIVIRESDGTILGYVTAATVLPACYTSTVQDGIMNVSDICATGSSFNISWETTDSPSGGGVNQCSHCLNGIQDEDETNVDCGGIDCLPCGPSHCYNGMMDFDETSADCGGSCNGFGGTACCDNGYQDYDEYGVDCGPNCSAPAHDSCTTAIPLGEAGCNYNATSDGDTIGSPFAIWAPDAGNSPMDFSTICDLYNITAGTFRWVAMNNGVFYTINTTVTEDFNLLISNINCDANGVIQAGLYTNNLSCDMGGETLMGCAMTDQVDMTFFIPNLPAGSYTLVIDGADGSRCSWNFSGSGIMDSNCLSVLSDTNYVSVCQNDSFYFADGIYYDGSNSPHMSLFTTSNGCDSTLTTFVTNLSGYTIQRTEYVCEGSTFTFPDGDTSSISITDTSVFAIGNGCDSVIITMLFVDGEDAQVSVSGGILFCQNDNVNYQWINCASQSIIPGETNQDYEPTVGGSYAVIVEENGCVDTSDCHTIIISGIETSMLNQFTVVPNPFIEEFFITMAIPLTNVKINVYDILGKEIELETSQGESGITIKSNSLAKGIYILEILQDKEIVGRKKIMKE